MAARTIVIVGGAVSGPTAAARARELDEGARIVLLERSRDVSYAACGLAYHLSGEAPSLEALNRERADFFWDVYRVEVRTGASVVAIDAEAHVVRLKGEALRYGALVYAAGAESVAPTVPNLAGAANVFRFRTLKDIEGILGRLKGGARRVAILGGGFIGVEAADGFLRYGSEVTLIERGPQILPAFTAGVAMSGANALIAAGARVLTGADVVRAEREGRNVRALKLKGGGLIPADLVVIAAGLRPRTDLLRRAGARLLPDGSVPVDNRCLTSLPDVFACGVCVSLPHAVSDKPVWTAQAALADKTAQVAGANAAGGDVAMGPALGTAIVRAGDRTLARTGLTHAEAAAYAGSELQSVRIHAPSCEPYFPGSTSTTIELLYHGRNGRILGAEVAAATGADKRVDVLAAAILGGLSVDRLGSLDLAYAPPYAPARDPINVAGVVAEASRQGQARAWTPTDLSAQRRSLTLVDVRSAAEHRAGTIGGALGLPLSKLRRGLRALTGKTGLVFLCDSGRLGYLAARIARQRGHAGAGYLCGGLRSWIAEGQALSQPKAGR